MQLTFEAYTYFGRVTSKHVAQDNETYHMAAESARLSCKAFETEHGQPAWVRYVETPYV